jgi:hypothetical protein
MKRLAFLDPNTYRKQKIQVSANGGSEPGDVGISPSVNTWSDMRMPFHRTHIIPNELPGIMSDEMGSKAVPWLFSSDTANEIPSLRAPQTLAVNTHQYQLENNQAISTGVMPALQLDPFASLPDDLRVPMLGGSASLIAGGRAY